MLKGVFVTWTTLSESAVKASDIMVLTIRGNLRIL